MSRKSYNCGGKGRHGTPAGPCTICGKQHPKGKIKKSNWRGCISASFSSETPIAAESKKVIRRKKLVVCDKCNRRKVRHKTEDGKFCRQCV